MRKFLQFCKLNQLPYNLLLSTYQDKTIKANKKMPTSLFTKFIVMFNFNIFLFSKCGQRKLPVQQNNTICARKLLRVLFLNLLFIYFFFIAE